MKLQDKVALVTGGASAARAGADSHAGNTKDTKITKDTKMAYSRRNFLKAAGTGACRFIAKSRRDLFIRCCFH